MFEFDYKTQAQKKLERQKRAEENEKIRQEKKSVYGQIAQQNNLKNKEVERKEKKPLSKKERRQEKQKNTELSNIAPREDEQKNEIDSMLSTSSLTVNYTPLIFSSTLEVAAKEKAIEAVKKESSNLSAGEKNLSRVVQNHSTYCKGLKSILAGLQKNLPDCTISPGALSQVESKCETFELRFQRKTDKHTYKFAARSGHTVQDVLISVPDVEIFTEEFICQNIKKTLEYKAEKINAGEQEESDEDICLSRYNKASKYERDSFWKNEYKEKYQQIKAHEKEIKEQKKIEVHKRRLANKPIDPTLLDEYAKRDVSIISGETRTRNSLRK
jgi:hypothetical protein